LYSALSPFHPLYGKCREKNKSKIGSPSESADCEWRRESGTGTKLDWILLLFPCPHAYARCPFPFPPIPAMDRGPRGGGVSNLLFPFPLFCPVSILRRCGWMVTMKRRLTLAGVHFESQGCVVVFDAGSRRGPLGRLIVSGDVWP